MRGRRSARARARLGPLGLRRRADPRRQWRRRDQGGAAGRAIRCANTRRSACGIAASRRWSRISRRRAIENASRVSRPRRTSCSRAGRRGSTRASVSIRRRSPRAIRAPSCVGSPASGRRDPTRITPPGTASSPPRPGACSSSAASWAARARPTRRCPVAGWCASQLALHGILAALIDRERTGRGRRVETSLVQALGIYDLVNWLPGLHDDAARRRRSLSAVHECVHARTASGSSSRSSRRRSFGPSSAISGSTRSGRTRASASLRRCATRSRCGRCARSCSRGCARRRMRSGCASSTRIPTSPSSASEAPPRRWIIRSCCTTATCCERDDPEVGRLRELGPLVRFSATPSRPGRAAPGAPSARPAAWPARPPAGAVHASPRPRVAAPAGRPARARARHLGRDAARGDAARRAGRARDQDRAARRRAVPPGEARRPLAQDDAGQAEPRPRSQAPRGARDRARARAPRGRAAAQLPAGRAGAAGDRLRDVASDQPAARLSVRRLLRLDGPLRAASPPTTRRPARSAARRSRSSARAGCRRRMRRSRPRSSRSRPTGTSSRTRRIPTRMPPSRRRPPLLLALYHRARTGEGQAVETSDAVLERLGALGGLRRLPGTPPARDGRRGAARPRRALPPLRAPRRAGSSSPARHRAAFAKLCESLGAQELAQRSALPRRGRRAAVTTPSSRRSWRSLFAKRPAAEWEAELTARGVGCVRADRGPFARFAFDEPFMRESGFVTEVEDPELGRYRRFGPTRDALGRSGRDERAVPRGRALPADPRRAGPLRGAHRRARPHRRDHGLASLAASA